MAAVTKSSDGEKAMSEAEEPVQAETAPSLSGGSPTEPPKGTSNQAPKPGPATPNFFTLRKRGQGYWTRMGTAIAAGFLGLMISFEIYQQTKTFVSNDPPAAVQEQIKQATTERDQATDDEHRKIASDKLDAANKLADPWKHHDRNVALMVAIPFLIAYSLVAFWFTNKPNTVDFLIATDSEMKKVNWTTRKELIGSTKIVILFMFLIAIMLFEFDVIFGEGFHFLGVLKTRPLPDIAWLHWCFWVLVLLELSGIAYLFLRTRSHHR